jgi:hypothetical protein
MGCHLGRIKGVVRKWLHAGRPYLAKKGVVLQMAVIGAEDALSVLK